MVAPLGAGVAQANKEFEGFIHSRALNHIPDGLLQKVKKFSPFR